jgi:tetratricopeptide (TPR) repeat protein
MNRRERRAAARGSKTTLSTATANTPAALYQAGLQHFRAGRHLDAQLCCQQALALDAEHADTLHLLGQLSLDARQYDHAVEWISRAIRQNPKTEYLTNLGIALRNQGRREEALKVFDKAVQLDPNDADLWRNLGNALTDAQRPADALLSFQQALKLNPRHWDAAQQCGHLLYRLGRLEEALVHFDQCNELQPNHAKTLQMRALATYGLDQFEEALADIRRAHALDPANADVCNNSGVFLRRLGREEEALPWFDKALKLRPNFRAALVNKAFALTQIRRFVEAFAVYNEMNAVDPGNVEADYDVSLLHLLTGNFEAGWAGREARWNVPGLSIARFEFPQPVWLGKESIAGKTLLVYADEGLGDTIQFSRYARMAAARGARVILMVQDALCPLLAELAGASQCLPRSAGTPPAFDAYCPITSLPLAFATKLETIPSATPYLPAPAASRLQAWEDRLGPHDRLRIGLVWSGNPKHRNDLNRSIPLHLLARIVDVDATFVSLQKDPRPDDGAILHKRNDIVDLTSHLTDFAETAALVSCLDLVIAVDTSVAHLAGALGRPTWILLPFVPDYRWLLDRDDSPWYPTVRLFRQNETRDYADVVDRVRKELAAIV